jgi:hypothetical protein
VQRGAGGGSTHAQVNSHSVLSPQPQWLPNYVRPSRQLRCSHGEGEGGHEHGHSHAAAAAPPHEEDLLFQQRRVRIKPRRGAGGGQASSAHVHQPVGIVDVMA